MVIAQVEEIEIAAQAPTTPKRVRCTNCSGRASLDQRARYQFRHSMVQIDFVFHGWTCSDCGEASPPMDAQEEISKVLDDRFVSLGLRPGFDSERVRAIRRREAKRRSARRNGLAS